MIKTVHIQSYTKTKSPTWKKKYKQKELRYK